MASKGSEWALVGMRVASVSLMAVGLATLAWPQKGSITVSNREPKALEVGYLPDDGSASATNPPAMAWLHEPLADAYFLELSQDPQFSSGSTVQVERTPYCLYTHTEPLAPGRWYWRYGLWTADGKRSQWSPTRSFVIEPEAVEFPRPTMQSVRRALPRSHPRVFLRPEQVPMLREAAQGSLSGLWATLKSRADAFLGEPLLPEPPPWSDGKWNATEWRRNYGAVVRACNGVETVAFAYLVSGEEKYARRAREWLLHIASWDPAGTTSMRVNDEAGMPILHITPRAYDWIYDFLSEEDRNVMRRMIRARGKEAYQRLHGRPYEQLAHDSHGGRMWHFLGEAAIAYHGEVAEADRWLEYALTIFWGWYPIWSDPDGGWSEGVGYWTSYVNRVTRWLDALKAASGVDGTQKPFFRTVGDFALYCASPGSPISGFGDGSERSARSATGRVVNHYADAVRNPHWKWYAQRWGATDYEETPIGFLRAVRPSVEAKTPDDLPLAKIFRSTGWVAMHTDLSEAANNVQLMFRSSPMGNISHAHADQNNLVLAAYGEPLLVNTGLRPWYGSRFCEEYYWATLSHNCVLVNGQGQPRSPQATGKVVAFKHDGDFTYAAGDASAAYPNAQEAVRRIMFLRGDPAIVVLHDRVVMAEPGKVQWLMHARSPFRMEPKSNRVMLRHGRAQMRVTFVTPPKLQMSQTDHYPLEPEMGKTVPEWHFTAENVEPNEAVEFVTLIEIAREGGGLLGGKAEPLGAMAPGVRFRRGDEMIAVAFADRAGYVRLDDLAFSGDAVAVVQRTEQEKGTEFRVVSSGY